MIAFLQGRLESKREHKLVLNVAGVGYNVEISTQTYERLPSEGKELKLLTYHHITDNDQRLFGFFTEREKKLFEKLITVKGVGPKLGLTILSGMNAEDLVMAIVDKDLQGLSRISGIGKKTAERIVLELKEKILEHEQIEGSGQKAGTSGKREESISALEALGFRKRDAEKAVMKIIKDNDGAEVSEIVKKALARFEN